jgi:phosphatidylcholine synthase
VAQRRRFGAFLIHVLTASGAAFALLAMMAAHQHRWSVMFALLGCALMVDAVDGPLARRFDVVDVLPRWSGATLDLVVDFVTYVFVPAYAIAVSGLMPSPLSVAAGVIIVVTAALYFADGHMKMNDNYFRGFPALWNVVAFYLLLLRPASWVAAAAIAALAVASFVPFPFIHPLRVVRLRAFNVVLLIIWAVLAAITVAHDMSPGPWITAALCTIGLYILLGGALRRAL